MKDIQNILVSLHIINEAIGEGLPLLATTGYVNIPSGTGLLLDLFLQASDAQIPHHPSMQIHFLKS